MPATKLANINTNASNNGLTSNDKTKVNITAPGHAGYYFDQGNKTACNWPNGPKAKLPPTMASAAGEDLQGRRQPQWAIIARTAS